MPVAVTLSMEAGKDVRHIELADVFGIGKDHVATEHRNGQATHVVGLAQQHLAGPFTVGVAVGVAVVDLRSG